MTSTDPIKDRASALCGQRTTQLCLADFGNWQYNVAAPKKKKKEIHGRTVKAIQECPLCEFSVAGGRKGVIKRFIKWQKSIGEAVAVSGSRQVSLKVSAGLKATLLVYLWLEVADCISGVTVLAGHCTAAPAQAKPPL